MKVHWELEYLRKGEIISTLYKTIAHSIPALQRFVAETEVTVLTVTQVQTEKTDLTKEFLPGGKFSA